MMLMVGIVSQGRREGAQRPSQQTKQAAPGNAAQLQKLWRNPKAWSTTIEVRCPAVSSHRSRWRTGCWEPKAAPALGSWCLNLPTDDC